MKKINLFLFLILYISFASAYPVHIYLEEIMDQNELIQLNGNIDSIKDNYNVDIKFILERSENPVTKDSLFRFGDLLLFQNNDDNWNTLVYYNIEQNKLRFVTYKDCNFVFQYLKELKEKDFIRNVLESPNPSNEQISNMLF